MRLSRLLLLSSVLLLPGVAAAQDNTAASTPAGPKFTLTGTAGVMGFQLSSLDTGVFGHTAGGSLFGGMIAGNVTANVQHLQNGQELLVSLAGFGAFAHGQSTFTDTLTGPGTVVITGLRTPAVGSIALQTSSGSPAATVANTNPEGGNSNSAVGAAGGATNNVGTVNPAGTGNSFILAHVATSAAGDAAAYGAIADSSGGVFVAAGDIDGLAVTTTVSRDLLYAGADLTAGLAGKANDTTSFVLYGGPSVRLLKERDSTAVAIDPAEFQPSVVTFPTFTITHVDQIAAHYFGGVAGANVNILGPNNVLFTFGLEGGLYAVSASLRGTDTYSTCCGDFDAASPISGASPSLSVPSNVMAASLGSTTAFALRGNGAVTFPVRPNMALTLGGQAEYLSRVPRVGHSGLTQTTAGAEDVTWSSAAPGAPPTTSFTWGSMFDYALTASITGSF